MLVLSRRVGERIIIGEGENKIEVQVTDIKKDAVKIGITAKKDVPVHREEVAIKIKSFQ